MTLRTGLMALVGLGLALAGTGCATNKANAERDSLLNQNKQQGTQITQLESELQQANAARQTAEARANSATAQLTAPTAGGADSGGVMDLTGSGSPVGGARGGRGTTAVRTNTAPPAARGAAANGGQVVIEVSGDVLFDSGKTSIKSTATKSLDTIAARIKKEFPGRRIRIEGHTDSTPIKSTLWKDNTELGMARAKSVMAYLVKKGIPQKEMYAASKGSSEPKSKTNLAVNRRVEIVIEK